MCSTCMWHMWHPASLMKDCPCCWQHALYSHTCSLEQLYPQVLQPQERKCKGLRVKASLSSISIHLCSLRAIKAKFLSIFPTLPFHMHASLRSPLFASLTASSSSFPLPWRINPVLYDACTARAAFFHFGFFFLFGRSLSSPSSPGALCDPTMTQTFTDPSRPN